MSKRNSRLRGIVVTGDTIEQALDQFRAVASGTSYTVLESKDGQDAFATADVVGMQIMNPLNGEELVQVPTEERHAMVATASADSEEEMDVVYKVCASGCNVHVVADSDELLQKCPSCASNLPPMEDAEVNQKPTQVNEVLLAVASTRKEAIQAYRALASGACETFAAQCGEQMVISNKPLNFNIYKGTPAVASEGYVPQMTAPGEGENVEDFVPQMAVASSNEEGKLNCHWLATASAEGSEAVHIICSDQTPIFCPQTSAGLIDPADTLTPEQIAAVASSEDDEDEELDDDEFEEEEEDDEDEEEDDEEDDEEEEEEEDDEDLSLSLANTSQPQVKKTKKGGVGRKPKVQEQATASAVAVGAPVMQPITASFVAYASSEMNDASIDVTYVGEIQGDPTWMAFHEGVPFAKATASNAENPATFADAAFGRAFKALASEVGVTAALEQTRFEEIKPVINVEQLVATQIATEVEAQTAALASAHARDTAELSKRFESAIATASQGINRGYFPNIQNPIRVALASTLESLGIQGGDVLIAKAFADHDDAHQANILAKACEITGYDLTVQNQMTAAIGGIKEANVETATASSLSVGRPVNTPVKQTQTKEVATASSVQTSATPSFKEKLNNLRF